MHLYCTITEYRHKSTIDTDLACCRNRQALLAKVVCVKKVEYSYRIKVTGIQEIEDSDEILAGSIFFCYGRGLIDIGLDVGDGGISARRTGGLRLGNEA